MIEHIKIYGERNSGTRYMRQLLVDNIVGAADRLDSDGIDDAMLGWKHGFPMLRPNTLYVIMLRPIYCWLPSMYSYPYCCWHVRDQSKDFQEFVSRPFFSSNRSQSFKYCGEFKSILHARWQKYQAYFKLHDHCENVILFNIEALKHSKHVVPKTLSAVRFPFRLKHDNWKGIATSVADPKEQSRTRSNRYEMTIEDGDFVDDLIGRYKRHALESRVESVAAVCS